MNLNLNATRTCTYSLDELDELLEKSPLLFNSTIDKNITYLCSIGQECCMPLSCCRSNSISSISSSVAWLLPLLIVLAGVFLGYHIRRRPCFRSSMYNCRKLINGEKLTRTQSEHTLQSFDSGIRYM